MSFLKTLLLSHALLAGVLCVPTSNNNVRRHHQDSHATVNTSSGVFAVQHPPAFPGIASLPNIPYAKNPTGPLRFAPPVLATPPANGAVQNVSDLPAGCFQYVASNYYDTVGWLAGNRAGVFQRGDYSNTTEDCLRLSIFAPKSAVEKATSTEHEDHHDHHNCECEEEKEHELLPVVVWIHGGGYSLGGINTPYQLAPNWVQRSQRHIVVQVQYRVNILGLPNAAGLASEKHNANLNLALLDQRLAVEWVRDNIASIGGDPRRITLWGQSAGGYSTDGYLYAWAHDPIVAGVIADSGNALSLEPYSTSSANYTQFSSIAARFGCSDLVPADELACMRAVPASDLQTYIQAAPGKGGAADDGLAFPTLVDNVTIFANYSERIAAGGNKFPARVPLLIGTNTDEGTALVPFVFNGSVKATSLPPALESPAEGFKLGLQCTTIREVRLRAEAGAKTWQYLYTGNFSDISPRPWLGAYHTAELPLIFGTYATEEPATSFERRVSERMQDLYLAFLEDPHAGLSRAKWPLATGALQSAQILELAAEGKVEQLIDVDGLRDECEKAGFEV